MTNQPDLAGLTFDQQRTAVGDAIDAVDISPNRRIPGEVVLEPVLNGVRVTARDAEHRVLWGFIGSKAMLTQHHCPVAVYETLQELLGEELAKQGLPTPDHGDPMPEAQRALAALQETLDGLKSSITVKKASPATLARARAIIRIANDAEKMISLEASSVTSTQG